MTTKKPEPASEPAEEVKPDPQPEPRRSVPKEREDPNTYPDPDNPPRSP